MTFVTRKDLSPEALEYYQTSTWEFGLEPVFIFYYLENLDTVAKWDIQKMEEFGLNRWYENPAIHKSYGYTLHN